MTDIEERLYSHIYHNSSAHLINDISLNAEIQDDKSFVCGTSNVTKSQKEDNIITILSNDSDDDIVEIVEKKPICIVIDSDNEGKNHANGKNESFVIPDRGRYLNNPNHQTDNKKKNTILGKNKIQANKTRNRNNMKLANSSKQPRFNVSISKSLDPHLISGDYSQFNHNSIIANMIRDRNKWKINYTDMQGPSINNREKRVRCHNCHQTGHVKLSCPDPIKGEICYMCGLQGHLEPRCPKRMCLACGVPSFAFVIGCHKCRDRHRLVCSMCNMAGHNENTCPDLWRRYHRSIDPTKSPVVQHSGLKDTRNLFCSNCSARGHIYDNCSKLRINEHSLSLPNIVKYDAVLPIQSVNLNNNSKSSLNNGNFNTVDVNRINGHVYLNKSNNMDVRTSNECLDAANQVSSSNVNNMNGGVSPDIKDSLQKEHQSLNADNTDTDNNSLVDSEPQIFDFMRPANINIPGSGAVCIVIDKYTVQVLMKPEGAKFLHNVSKSLSTKVEIQLSRYGGLLYVNDHTKEQPFRKHLKDWIKAVNTKLLSTHTYVKLPNKTKSLINFIQSLKATPCRQISNPSSKYRTLLNITNNDYSVISNKQVKLYHKTIRQLNLFFFEQNGLREGEFHANKLNELVKQLDTISETVIPKELYEEIKSHYDYIFTTDHGNYKELIELYRKKKNRNISSDHF